MTWAEDFQRVYGEPPPDWFTRQMEAGQIVAPQGVALDTWLIQKYGQQTASEYEKARVLVETWRQTGGYSEEYLTAYLQAYEPLKATGRIVETVAVTGTSTEMTAIEVTKAVPTFLPEYLTEAQQYEQMKSLPPGPPSPPGGAAGGGGALAAIAGLILPFLLGG